MPYADPEKANENRRESYHRNLATQRESNKLAQRRFRECNPDAQRGFTLKYRYGISAEVYDAMLEEQGGKCAICREACRTGRALAVDHDSSTGQVRGLLCRACNGGIGAMGDSVENLERAAEYLREALR